jgi:hypothetical protein
MMKTLLSLAVVIYLTSGCSWHGYKGPGEFKSVNTAGDCMHIGIQNLTLQQQRAINAAANDVCAILESPEFTQAINGKIWLASCERINNQPDYIAGDKVIEVLRSVQPRFSVFPRKPFLAVGLADIDHASPDNNRVAINPKYIADALSDEPALASELRNTMAHELTHVVSADFTDDGHGSRSCPDDQLVSYAVGKLVEELWLRRHSH